MRRSILRNRPNGSHIPVQTKPASSYIQIIRNAVHEALGFAWSLAIVLLTRVLPLLGMLVAALLRSAAAALFRCRSHFNNTPAHRYPNGPSSMATSYSNISSAEPLEPVAPVRQGYNLGQPADSADGEQILSMKTSPDFDKLIIVPPQTDYNSIAADIDDHMCIVNYDSNGAVTDTPPAGRAPATENNSIFNDDVVCRTSDLLHNVNAPEDIHNNDINSNGNDAIINDNASVDQLQLVEGAAHDQPRHINDRNNITDGSDYHHDNIDDGDEKINTDDSDDGQLQLVEGAAHDQPPHINDRNNITDGSDYHHDNIDDGDERINTDDSDDELEVPDGIAKTINEDRNDDGDEAAGTPNRPLPPSFSELEETIQKLAAESFSS